MVAKASGAASGTAGGRAGAEAKADVGGRTTRPAERPAEMVWETHPVTPDRFEDFADVINPNRRATHCWCLSHRVNAAEIEALGGGSREAAMRRLCTREHPPGVVTYRDGTPVGWCSISPRAEIPRLLGSKLIRPVDDVPVWSIICVVVRGGHRRQGVVGHLLEGAVAYAAAAGAPAVEAHPVDPAGRMDTTMAFVGTRSMFERAGFSAVGTTDAVASRMPRLVMRRTLP
jgi:GNAT superfamily N-acetyltransferase